MTDAVVSHRQDTVGLRPCLELLTVCQNSVLTSWSVPLCPLCRPPSSERSLAQASPCRICHCWALCFVDFQSQIVLSLPVSSLCCTSNALLIVTGACWQSIQPLLGTEIMPDSWFSTFASLICFTWYQALPETAGYPVELDGPSPSSGS